MVTTPTTVPVLLGVKLTAKVHLARALSVLPQPLVMLVVTPKSPVGTKEMLTPLLRWFVSVIVLGPLVVPTVWAAKVRLAGEKVRGRAPMPERLYTCGVSEALSAMFTISFSPSISGTINGAGGHVRLPSCPW